VFRPLISILYTARPKITEKGIRFIRFCTEYESPRKFTFTSVPVSALATRHNPEKGFVSFDFYAESESVSETGLYATLARTPGRQRGA
jgi:hypothetical protein